jgi:hypothetical protein
MTTMLSRRTSQTELSSAPTGSSAAVTLRRHAAGWSMIAAGAVGLAGFLTAPWEQGSSTADYLASLTAHPTQAMISMAILHWGYLLFVPTAFVLARLARRRSPRLAAAGLVLSVIGSGLSGFLVTDAYDLSIGQHLPTSTAVQVSDGVSGGAMVAIGLPTVFGAMLGLVLLLVAMWRAKWVSVVPAIAMLAGWVLSFQAHGAVRACTGFALVAVALAWVGMRVLRAPNAHFDSGEC